MEKILFTLSGKADKNSLVNKYASLKGYACYEELKKESIYSRKYFYPLTSDAACFKNKYKKISLKNARLAADSILVLPLYPELEFEIIEKITKIIMRSIM